MLPLLALTLALLAQQAPQAADVAAERRAAIIAECHIDADRLVVSPPPQPDLGYGLVVKGSAPLTDDQLLCYRDHFQRAEYLYADFEDVALGDRYSRVLARYALWQTGILGKLPIYDSAHDTPADFAVQLEKRCDARPHSALQAVGANIEVIVQTSADESPQDFDLRHCAMNAATASGFDIWRLDPPPQP